MRSTAEQRAWAKRVVSDQEFEYSQRSNSEKKGRGIYASKVAERVVCETLGLKYVGTIHSDTEVQTEIQIGRYTLLPGQTIEIKNGERPSGRPKPSYNAHIAAHNPNQQCDYYLLTSSYGNALDSKRINDLYICICGIISKEDFFSVAVFAKEGDRDGETGLQNENGFPCDCYNINFGHPLMCQIGDQFVLQGDEYVYNK